MQYSDRIYRGFNGIYSILTVYKGFKGGVCQKIGIVRFLKDCFTKKFNFTKNVLLQNTPSIYLEISLSGVDVLFDFTFRKD